MARKLETVTLSGQTVTWCHKDRVEVVSGNGASYGKRWRQTTVSGQTATWCHKDGVKVGMVQAMAKDGDRPQSLEPTQAMVRELVTTILSGQTVTSCHKDGVKVVPGDDQSCCQKLGSSHHAPSCLRVTYNSNKKRKKWTVSLFRTGRRWSVLAGIPQYLQQQQKEKEMDSLLFRT